MGGGTTEAPDDVGSGGGAPRTRPGIVGGAGIALARGGGAGSDAEGRPGGGGMRDGGGGIGPGIDTPWLSVGFLIAGDGAAGTEGGAVTEAPG